VHVQVRRHVEFQVVSQRFLHQHLQPAAVLHVQLQRVVQIHLALALPQLLLPLHRALEAILQRRVLRRDLAQRAELRARVELVVPVQRLLLDPLLLDVHVGNANEIAVAQVPAPAQVQALKCPVALLQRVHALQAE